MGLLLPIILASFVLLQVFDTELGKPKSTENSEVTTSEIQTSEEKSAKIENDVAIKEPKEEVKVVEPTETKATGKRARNDKGQLKADDPTTPNYNEAWEGGVAPKE